MQNDNPFEPPKTPEEQDRRIGRMIRDNADKRRLDAVSEMVLALIDRVREEISQGRVDCSDLMLAKDPEGLDGHEVFTLRVRLPRQ